MAASAAHLLRFNGDPSVTLVYRDFDQQALDFQYNNQAHVADPMRYIAWYRTASEAARARVAHVRDVAYGSLPDEFFYKLQGMPRLLILHGARDENIPIINAQQLIKLCEIKRFECESHIYSDQAHGFAGQALEDADQRTLKFISEIKPSIHN